MIIGHEVAIKGLMGRAKEHALPHGMLFYGPARVGKGAVALGLAHYLERGVFDHEEAAAKPLIDALNIEPDAQGTVGIDRARELRSFLYEYPQESSQRTAIVNNAERLTLEAQNALLKIAEEPPSAALIIAVTSDPESLLPTFRSRLAAVFFGTVSEDETCAWLIGRHGVAPKEARSRAKESRGQPGYAWAFLHDERFKNALEAAREFFASGRERRPELIKERVAEDDFDIDRFLEGLLFLKESVHGSVRPGFWHRVFELRRDASYFNLNARLQLNSLTAEM